MQSEHIILDFVNFDNQLVRIFAKSMNEENICVNRLELSIICWDIS